MNKRVSRSGHRSQGRKEPSSARIKDLIKKGRLHSYHELLLESLQDPDAALAYLNAALAEEDPRAFLLALKNVIEARGGDMSAFATRAQLNRENLYRMLSKKGNPKLTSIRSVLDTMGLQLTIQASRSR